MEIEPAYAHMPLQSEARQGLPPMRTLGLVGIHAPAGCGIQGCGVRTPKAAAVAAATCGFAMDEHIPNGGMFDYTEFDTERIDDLLDDSNYFLRYSSIMNAKIDEIEYVGVAVSEDDNLSNYYVYSPLTIQADEQNPSAEADIERVMEAYRKDFAEHGEVKPKDAVVRINISYHKYGNQGGSSFLGEVLSLMSYGSSEGDKGYVGKDYTETLKAMREIGVLDEDNKLNTNSWYYQNPYR